MAEKKPLLVVIAGPNGSGKSVVTEKADGSALFLEVPEEVRPPFQVLEGVGNVQCGVDDGDRSHLGTQRQGADPLLFLFGKGLLGVEDPVTDAPF